MVRPAAVFLYAALPLVALAAAPPAAADPAAPAATLPAPLASYSAWQHLTLNGEGQDLRIYHAGARERREGRDGGLESILIVRADKGDAYILQPDSHMALALAASDPEAAPDLKALASLPAQPLGPDTLGGLAVTRYHVEGRLPPLPGSAADAPPRGFTGEVWSTPDGIYVKLDGIAREGGQDIPIAYTLSDVRPGPQPSTLFEVPGDYRPMRFGPIDAPPPPGLRD